MWRVLDTFPKMNKLFILLFFFVSRSAFAVDYYWEHGDSAEKFGSAIAAANDKCGVSAGPGWSFDSFRDDSDDTRKAVICKHTAGSKGFSGYVTRSGSGCTAPKVYDPATSSCTEPDPPPDDDDCKVEPLGVRRFWDNGAKDASAIPQSYNGCAIKVDEFIHCYRIVSGPNTGKGYCEFRVSQTGGKRQPQNAGPEQMDSPVGGETVGGGTSPELPPDDKGKCPAGTVQAGVDSRGTPICVGKGTGPDQPKAAPPKTETSQTTQNPDGSTTVTKTTITTNSDGSKTTVVTKETTAAGGGQVTTEQTAQTGNTPTGEAGRTDPDAEQEKSEFCKQNPMLTVCQNSTVRGACREVSCTGDAIQCATLRAAAAMECNAREDTDALKAMGATTLGQSILSGSDPMANSLQALMKGEDVDMSRPNLDQSGFLGGGSCFGTKNFVVMGQSISMDFSAACENIQPIRYAILALAFFAAYMIVARSVLSS